MTSGHKEPRESDIRELEPQGYAAPEWPFPHWDRYEFRAFIGQGAMGQVFSVFDPVLSRRVAMKVLSERGMPYASLFLEEARAQARVEHPHVAKVHEVGEERGRPYVTMQHLNGESLETLCKKLRMEEIVEILRQACEGVQAAHAMGLLHRDLKPANIVVNRDDEARWHAFVVDFGMACEKVDASTAPDPSRPLETGKKVMGTPAFMSPEQAAGFPLDVRSDVFSLGSTLCFALTGTLSFEGNSLDSESHALLNNQGLSQKGSPRKFKKSIPKDLQAILFRAMAPSPQDRYPSAKALGQDLKRWLDGDPVEAMKKSALYRLHRWTKKNRLLAASMLVLGLTLTGTGLWVLRQRTRAQKQAYYYHYFAQEAELMEASLALAESFPLHDTLPERERIREQMKHLEKIMEEAGGVAEAPGRYALGRGHMTQSEWAAARKSLEQAWALGLQTPEVAFALGSTLSHLYSEALQGLAGQAYQDRKAQLDKTLKPAILSYLSKARQITQSSLVTYVEALLANEEGRHEEALAKADAVLKAQPWKVDALLLKAKIHLAMATDTPSETSHLVKAKAIVKKAQDLARSCARAYEMEGEVSHQQMFFALAHRQAFMPYFEAVQASAAKARQAHSRSAQADVQEALSLLSTRDGVSDWYWEDKAAERATQDTLRRIIALADRALALQPDKIMAIHIKGEAFWKLAEEQLAKGLEPFHSLEAAIQAFLQASQIQPGGPALLGGMATAYAVKAYAEAKHGQDPSASFREALRYYRQVESMKPDAVLYSNIAYLYFDKAKLEFWQGLLPKESLESALKAIQQALAMQAVFNNRSDLPRTYLFMAEYAAWRGEKDLKSLRLGMEEAERMLERDPGDLAALLFLAKGELLKSFMDLDTKDLGKARGLFQKLKAGKAMGTEYRLMETWLALEEFRQRPDWRGYLSLEKRIHAANTGRNPKPEWHFLGFEACRIGWQKKAPGARDAQWRERAESHLQKAKEINPLAGPETERLLKTLQP